MIILLSGLFIVAIALAVYAFIPFQPGEKKPQEPLILRSEEQVNSLTAELEQLKAECQNLQSEIEKQKAVNSDLLNKLKVFEAQIEEYKQEIEKQKAIIQKPALAEEQVSKKEYDELKKKLEEAEQILRIVHGAGKEEAQ